MRVSWFLPLLLALALLSAPASADPARSGADARHERGRAIYNFRCYYCHGYSGNARTLSATFLDPPPRDFTALRQHPPTRAKMIATVRNGIPGTGMAGFGNILTAEDITAVVDFVRTEFILAGRPNTRYHTAANGWPDHARYRAAFPFATGELPLDTPDEKLTPAQRRGKQLFLQSCISCHDRARVEDEGPLWETSAVSYPRRHTCCDAPAPDAVSGASVYARHDVAPKLADPDAQQRRGEALFQANCAFCHAADGTGRNWIGSFLEPHPRDLTDPAFMQNLTPSRLRRIIADGVPGTTMPAWRNVLDAQAIAAIVAYIDRAFHRLAREGKASGENAQAAKVKQP